MSGASDPLPDEGASNGLHHPVTLAMEGSAFGKFQ